MQLLPTIQLLPAAQLLPTPQLVPAIQLLLDMLVEVVRVEEEEVVGF